VKILSVDRIERVELLSRLRRTRLLGFDGTQPYASATLELAPATDTSALAPAQNYVLKSGVAKMLELRAALVPFGIDLFALDGGLSVRTADEPDEPIPVIPPVVEESREPDGRTVLLVNDGLHRTFAARSVGLPISVVIARDVPREFPYYAFALPDGWAGVALLDELPDRYQKKNYRRPDSYKSLFRDFNEHFPGVQRQRRRTNPDGLHA
jgi:hypothetical protein